MWINLIADTLRCAWFLIYILFASREKLVSEQLAKMPKLIENFRMKIRKETEKETKAADKQKRLLEEARDFFGYEISTKDPRFQQMKEAKEEEERKARKQKVKEERKAASILKLQALAAESKEKRQSSTEDLKNDSNETLEKPETRNEPKSS